MDGRLVELLLIGSETFLRVGVDGVGSSMRPGRGEERVGGDVYFGENFNGLDESMV